jgi:carbamoyl-phosphate synthase small subunit
MKKGVLVLENGESFEGFLWGADLSDAQYAQDRGYGEVVFNTSMTGYQEILTDPSYFGQMVCMTVAHIGNTGTNAEDPESLKPWCSGFIIQDESGVTSNWRSDLSLNEYLKKNGIPAISGIDTRQLTLSLRSKGVIRGILLPLEKKSEAASRLAKLPLFEGRDLISEVTTRETYEWETRSASDTKTKSLYHVVAMDFGAKHNLFRSLQALGCQITVVSAHATAAEILKYRPDGVFLSNGPGDPAMATYAVQTIKDLLGKTPIFGVCMGHQLLSLAVGAKTYKLKFGHRGGNQPVLDLTTQKVEISSQNHGYAVDDKSLPAHAKVTHINLNDKTVEGIEIPSLKAFSVQYHPEACPGPHDSQYLFQRFIDWMKENSRS